MTSAIQINNLTKRFPVSTGWQKILQPGELAPPAVDKVNLTINQGELFGLLGPNGAGKTTLIKMLCTLIKPSAGSARIFNIDIHQEGEIRKQFGLVSSEERSFYWRLSGRQNLEFFSSLYGINGDQRNERINYTLEQVGLINAANQQFQTYSTGMRQRLAIARGLLSEPRLIFFDEPSRGLDPNATAKLHQLIRNLRDQKGITIFLTTHRLDEAEILCERIAIMDQGRIFACGTIAELHDISENSEIYQLRLDNLPPKTASKLKQYRENIKIIQPDDQNMHSDHGIVIETKAKKQILNEVIDILRADNIVINNISRKEPHLDEIFSTLITLSHSENAQPIASAAQPSINGESPSFQDKTRIFVPSFSLPDFRVVVAFLKRDWQMETSYRISFLLQVIGIFFSVTMFYFISQLFGKAADPYLTSYGSDYFSFVLIGIAFASYFGVGLSTFSQKIRSAQTTGTLEAMLTTPTSYTSIILSSSLWDYIMTTFRVVIYLAIGIIFMGVSFEQANYMSAVVVLILSIITFSSLGIFASSFIMVLKRGDPVTWIINSVSSLLSGVYYPTAILPQALQWLAMLFPLTYSLHAMRLALLQGATISDLALEITALAIFCMILLPLSLISFLYSIKRAKIDGSLTQY